MPHKPKKPCAYPGCPRLTYGRYCEKHQKERDAQYEKFGRDRAATKRRYGKNWKIIRAAYVKKHPFCELCFQKGVLVPVEEVHHILPLAEGGTNDRDNLISLCMDPAVTALAEGDQVVPVIGSAFSEWQNVMDFLHRHQDSFLEA